MSAEEILPVKKILTRNILDEGVQADIAMRRRLVHHWRLNNAANAADLQVRAMENTDANLLHMAKTAHDKRKRQRQRDVWA